MECDLRCLTNGPCDLPENDSPCVFLECWKCGIRNRTVKRRSQRTAYHDDEKNFATLCDVCQIEEDEYWQERWADYYGYIME